MICDSIDIIQELENMFMSESDKGIFHKLKIIEYYIEFFCVHKKSFSETIEKIKEDSELRYFKPSRIEIIIKAYINSKNSSGYIQPIGKDLFLERFLLRYPTPLMTGACEDDWTVNSLQIFISMKYNCIITIDTIRKKLSKHKDFFDKKIKLSFKQSIPIYYIQLHKNPFPIRKELKQNPRAVRYLSLTWFIWGYQKNENIDIIYRQEPFSFINHDYKKEFLNLEYLFQIPTEKGLFLFDDTAYSREIFPKYYKYLSKNKIYPTNEAYILPYSHYDTTDSLMNKKLGLVIGLIRPIITYNIPRPMGSPEFFLFTDLLNKMKNTWDSSNEFLFDYYIEKEKINIPKLLKYE